ncbi:hypothetical protein PVAP13_1KG345900 [Panicum virgatum]|uniref:Uncharacterized protein n=1 Tax=Panicum virgatum TaxID=38727 RepID=A0A8T0XJE9_PANVG|nr:hypothetical protein PVAP13_1KG345900 [Panicum virgatum]KAG2659324.1 hypothetical protein PVAP13_1KG345900 [Panicum virgatum]KAG2659325.1 hypothetical protein PVAP13_1KG345900 [Panicum virgatum]
MPSRGCARKQVGKGREALARQWWSLTPSTPAFSRQRSKESELLVERRSKECDGYTMANGMVQRANSNGTRKASI